jgi:Domain of unknown function (DUF4276)
LVKLFVEGGGDAKDLKTECRQAFNQWLRSAGLKQFPKIVASGSRNSAFNNYKTALANGEQAILLIDSEDTVDDAHQFGETEDWKPWDHLKARDQWDRPVGAADRDCHLMVQCMENWFLGDVESLRQFFGANFNRNMLPATHPTIESAAKPAVLQGLKRASQNCVKKGSYGKGAHSFKILKSLDANAVIASAPWAKRFVDEMKLRFP